MSAKSNRSASSELDRQLDELIEDEDDDEDGQDRKKADNKKGENVLVMVRCRPLLGQSERASQTSQLARISSAASRAGQSRKSSASTDDNTSTTITVDEANKCVRLEANERHFYYDQVFGPQSDNERVYMRSARKLVEWAFSGFNCTIFLYGQTGTGKTYTHSSLTLNAFAHLFSLISDSHQDVRFLIRASYYELYNENIRDLLSSKPQQPLELRESKGMGGVYVKDLTCFLVNNLRELERLKQLGDKRRTVGATRMNEHSSRSHSIFSITIETISGSSSSIGATTTTSTASTTTTTTGQKPDAGGEAIRMGRLNLIDLAGSERQAKSGSSGLRLKEASRINLSLTCLSLVIRALTDANSTHVPYRSSKLTRLLSSSLGGNSKTLLIACISPAPLHLDETLNTLRFASRTKRIKNRAKINEDPKDALLRNYRRQVSELRKKLLEQQQQQQQQQAVDGRSGVQVSLGNDQQQQQQQQQVLLDQQLQMLKAKIMVGGENLLEKAEMHERLLEASKSELEEKRREELQLKARLNKKQELIRRMEQSKQTLEEQRTSLDEKLRRALVLYKRSREELRDLRGEHEELKDSLLQTIKATGKEIKYADCIIDDFIPRQHLDLINSCAQYDDDSDEWQIKLIAMSGNNIAQTRRLLESSSSSTNYDSSPRGPPTMSIINNNNNNNNNNNINDYNAESAPKTRPSTIRVAHKHRPNPYVRLSVK